MNQFGFRVKLHLCLRPPYTFVQWLRNVTEIHWNYRQGRIAFESDIHGTGITYDTQDVVEFEATLETDVAREF